MKNLLKLLPHLDVLGQLLVLLESAVVGQKLPVSLSFKVAGKRVKLVGTVEVE